MAQCRSICPSKLRRKCRSICPDRQCYGRQHLDPARIRDKLRRKRGSVFSDRQCYGRQRFDPARIHDELRQHSSGHSASHKLQSHERRCLDARIDER